MSVAELAGVMGGKRTSELIPLCHPIALTDLLVTVTPDRAAGGLRIRAEAATVGPTGVEMEALTAASVAALTVYDMVKGVERGVEIRSIHLVSKSGGQSGDWRRPARCRRVRQPGRPPAARPPARASASPAGSARTTLTRCDTRRSAVLGQPRARPHGQRRRRGRARARTNRGSRSPTGSPTPGFASIACPSPTTAS